MKRTFMIVLLSVAVAAVALAQQKPAGEAKPPADSKAAALPTADQIIDKYVAAIGGKAAIEKQTSRVVKGTFEIAAFGASGTFEASSKAPNKNVTVINVVGFGVVQEGFDGKVAWAVDPQSGLREKTGAELAAAKLEADFYRDARLKQLYPKIVVKGKDKVGDKDVYVVEATPAEISTETWYFDTQTGLLLRADMEREGPQGKQSIQTFMDNYREVDGIKMPFTLKQISSAFTLDLKFEEVKHGVAIDDAKFVKPSAQ